MPYKPGIQDRPNPTMHSPHWRRISFLLLVWCIFILAGGLPFVGGRFAPTARAQIDETTITLSPSLASIQGCETIPVQVWVNDVTTLYGADVRLSFDPTVLEVVDANPSSPGIQVQPGTLLDPPLFTTRNTADNTLGTIFYAGTQLNPTPPVSGSGVLITIFFRARGPGLTPLAFTYTKLSAPGGVEILADSSDGSVGTILPSTPVLSIAKLNAIDLRLTWTASTGVEDYQLYRESTPYFSPANPAYHTSSSLSFDDPGAMGDSGVNHFYVVRSTCSNGFQSADSNRVGEFDFNLVRDGYNTIALPLIDSSLATADDLGVATGATEVSRWVASTQSFDPRFVGFFGENFSLATGQAYFIYTPGSGPVVFTTVGEVPAPGSVSLQISRASTGCLLNLLSLPLDQDLIMNADSLGLAIGGVPEISEWRADTSSFDPRFVGFFGNNFSTRIGYPYWPCANTSGGGPTWP